jgi:serine/threonine protein kinase
MNNFSGQTLGHYHLIEKLGEGGMAVVYKAFDTHLECYVAVKVIRTDLLPPATLETALKRFEREAKAVAQLTHPNIVKVMEYGEQDGVPYLAMAYLSGGTLKDIVGRPIPYQEAAHLLAPIARALQYAHSRKIIHRDVKPSNILITESGEPMLTDFGIAKILDLQEGLTLTGTGVGLGTPEYMAPEQWTGSVSPSVDVYSLGVVFYELVTGRKPYTADTPAAVLIKTTNDPLPKPSIFLPGLPEKVEQVIYKAMAKKTGDRFESMRDLEIALEQLRVGSLFDAKPGTTHSPSDTSITMDTRSTKGESHADPHRQPRRIDRTNPIEKKRPHTKKAWLVTGLGSFLILGVFIVLSFMNHWFTTAIQPTTTPTVLQVPNVLVPSAETPKVTSTTYVSPDSNIISPIDGMELVFVPAGDFLMGSTEEIGYANEHPQHTVYLDGYWIDKTEVTNGMYAKCVEDSICTAPSSKTSLTHESYFGNPTFNLYPVINVSWDQASNYCQWAGRALPTEAQWEKAARGVEGRIYPWGNTILNQSMANYWTRDTVQVANYPEGASPYGVLDMAGNVWEWVADWYGENYYTESPRENPTGPITGDYHVVKGGSFYHNETYIRSALRSLYLSTTSQPYIGFRCAQPVN